MTSRLFKLLFLLFPYSLCAQNAVPVIQQFSATANWSTQILTVSYAVADAENDPLDISLEFSNNGGKTYALSAQVPQTGDVGFPVQPGANRTISCDLSQLSSGGATFTVRLVADDRQAFDWQSLVDEVDSMRLRADLEFVEGIRHYTAGLAHLNAVHDSLKNCFAAQGLFAEEHTFSYAANYVGRNVLGSNRGTLYADSVVIVDAHYDSIDNAPGADDNGSGTVGVLEVARLLSRYPSEKTLRFIGFDLEEAGLVGSARYVSSGLPTNEKVAGVFNFEMIGYYSEEPNSQQVPAGFNILFSQAYSQLQANQFRGDCIINVGNTSFPGLANRFHQSATQYVPDLKVLDVIMQTGIPVPDLLRSDHAPFWGANLPALMITDGANYRNKCYHTPSDTLDEKLNFTFMSNVVKTTVAAAGQLAGIRHGDWATASFTGTVGTGAPVPDCQVSSVFSPGGGRQLALWFGACPLTEASLDLFDSRGQLLHHEAPQLLPQQATFVLDGPELSAGIYFVKINAREGSRTIKVALP
ncbi:MAG: M28 family peptidase [Saprospiraceae bacterium]|nr:M28 family peptidase [Saprospiraceae bacterium]